jgi:hypothetical protein
MDSRPPPVPNRLIPTPSITPPPKIQITARLFFIPFVLGVYTIVDLSILTYQRIYLMTKYVYHQKGVNFKHPRNNISQIQTQSFGAGVGSFVAIYGCFKYALDRILTSHHPNERVILDKLTMEDRKSTIPITFARTMKMLGPFSASLGSIKEYFKVHKWQLTSTLLSFFWAISLSPVVHGITESYLSYHGDVPFSQLQGKIDPNTTLNSRDKLIMHAVEQEKQKQEKKMKSLS